MAIIGLSALPLVRSIYTRAAFVAFDRSRESEIGINTIKESIAKKIEALLKLRLGENMDLPRAQRIPFQDLAQQLYQNDESLENL